MGTDASKIVARFYQAALNRDAWPEAFATLAGAVDADVCALLVHDPRSGKGVVTQAWGVATAAESAGTGVPAATSLWFSYLHELASVPAVLTGHDLAGPSARVDRDPYRNWLPPRALVDHLFVVLDQTPSEVLALYLARAEHSGLFAEEDIQLMTQTAPFLQDPIRASRVVRRTEAENEAVLVALNAMPIGVVLVSANGVVVEANAIGRTVLDAGEGLVVANGGLAVETAAKRLKLKDLIALVTDPGTAGATRGLPLVAFRSAGKKPLAMLLMAAGVEWSDGPLAILYVGDPLQPVGFDHERIAKLYGLSRAESRVAALLATGLRLEQVAEKLGVAYETVRKHLKQIFSKTGTFRQAELVRMLVTGPAGLNL